MTRAVSLLGACLLLASTPVFAASGKVSLSFELGGDALTRGAPTGLDVLASIDSGWHIQAHQPTEKYLIPTVLDLEVPAGVKVYEVGYPKPEQVSFEFAPGKTFLVYAGKVGLATALELSADYASDTVPVKAVLHYQACNDENCLPPSVATAETIFKVGGPKAIAPQGATGGDDSGVVHWLDRYGYLGTFAWIALLGLGLNLTPCVYPLISITVSFFGTQSHGSTKRAVLLAILYVAGIAITFSTLGVAASLSGGLFGAALQKPIVLIGIATLMVVLALSCFGVYTLQPPPALMRVAGGAVTGALGAVFMGLTVGIVAAPCVGPAVLGLLTFVASRQDPVLGFALFAALAVGMGLPYVVFAAAAPSLRSLPRSGEWLLWVEHVFGFVLLGLAVYFIRPLLPATIRPFALPVLAFAAALYLGFIDRVGSRAAYFPRLKRAAGGIAMVVALWMGWPETASGSIDWFPYSEQVLADAKTAGVPVLLDVGAEWCLPCKEMDATTFRQPEVGAEARNFRMVKLDVTADDEENDRLSEKFLIRGVPTTVFIGRDGEEVERKVGYVPAEEMVDAMRRVLQQTRLSAPSS